MVDTKVEKTWNGKIVKIKGKKVIGKSIWELGLIIEGNAKLLSPVLTGRLAGSYTVQLPERGNAPKFPATQADVIAKPTNPMHGYVGTAVDYAIPVEFGAMGRAAQPALRPALDLARGKKLTVIRQQASYEFRDYLK